MRKPGSRAPRAARKISAQHSTAVTAASPGPASVLVVGTGALACLFAARLAAAGTPVAMLGNWPAGLQALRQHGVRLLGEGTPPTVSAYPVYVASHPGDCGPPPAFALVLVKSWGTRRAAGQLAACLPEHGLALTLQNGLGNRELLAQALGEGRVALGVTTTGATLVGPGLVRPAGGGQIVLGAHPLLAPLADLLRQAGFSVQLVPDPQALIWRKLVINAAINPLTALLDVPNGELLHRSAARSLMSAAAAEAYAVARALGIDTGLADPLAAVEAVAQDTAANISSMLQDRRRGGPTEVDAISGAVVRAGEKAGVPTPVNWTLWRLVRALQPNQPEVL